MLPDSGDNQIWRLIEPEALAWHCWDGDYVIFSARSGMTHTLDVVAGAIFEMALRGPATADDLRSRLIAFLGPDAPASLEGVVGATLARFDQLGLAEPVP